MARPRTIERSSLVLALLAVGVGIAAGLGAALFRDLIAIFHNLAFFGELSRIYDANQHTGVSPWGAWVIIVPMLGAVAVTFLVQNFAPEAKGHGVPEVIDAIYYRGGVIRPTVAGVKALASSISIATGGAVGSLEYLDVAVAGEEESLGHVCQSPCWFGGRGCPPRPPNEA